MRPPSLIVFLSTLGALLADPAAVVRAEPPPPGVIWLDVDGIESVAMETPSAFLIPLAEAGERRYLEVLGEVAFAAPELFGTLARRSGLSCQSCHVNGTTNPDLFINGASARKGGLDVTTGLFRAAAEDGVANHRDVPSLHGVSATPPYGRDGRFKTLRNFSRHAIVDEFAGAEPPSRILDALVAYQGRFGLAANPSLNDDGSLRAADAASRRGAALFSKPFARRPELSCASCHVRERIFVDGARHDVGTGGLFDTPTLRGIAATAPYFHDGRAASLGEVVAHFNTFYTLDLSGAEQADLVAYLEAVGRVEPPTASITLSAELEAIDRFRWLLGQAVNMRRYQEAALTVAVARRRIGELYARYGHDHQATARSAMIAWSRALQGVGRAVEAGDPQAARFAVLAFTSAFWEMVPSVIEQSAGALIKVP